MNLLFLCSKNKQRSLTAEKIYQNDNRFNVKSAGTETNARIKVTPGMIGWADTIFCMEKKHMRRIKENYQDMLPGKEIICLHIQDDYAFMDEELIEILKDYIEEYYLNL